MPFSRRSLKCHILSGVFGLSLLISRVFCKHGIEESLKLSWSERGIVNPEVVGSTPAKIPKTEKSNLHVFELHRPSSKGTKLLFHVIKATINGSVSSSNKSSGAASVGNGGANNTSVIHHRSIVDIICNHIFG